jgi:hypothetical protein
MLGRFMRVSSGLITESRECAQLRWCERPRRVVLIRQPRLINEPRFRELAETATRFGTLVS